MDKKEIEDILNNLDKNIDKITKEAYNEIIRLITKEGLSPVDAKKAIRDAISTINEDAAKEIANALNIFLSSTVTTEYVKNFKIEGVTLSKRLYNNLKDVELNTVKVINDAIKAKKTIKEIAKLLYEGYNFKDDPLKVMHKNTIPKWLKKELSKPPSKRSFNQYSSIKTRALKASYNKALESENAKELSKAVKVAFYEKSRYYANRIAQNEVMKSYSIERAKMIKYDKELDVVKVRMSNTHARVDICDYHSKVDKYGLGAGVYPKDKAPIPPFHPFCRCVLQPLYSKSSKDAKFNPKADKEFIKKYGQYEQTLIVGSQRRLSIFNKTGNLLKSAYLGSPLYVDEVGTVKYIGYNTGMKKVFSEKTITQKEKDVIKEWTIDSTNIKMTMWGLTDTHKEQADTLFGLFDKYESNLKKGTKLYRGMSFAKEDFKFYGYDKVKEGELHIPDKKAIISFSKSKRKAFEYATSTNRDYKVIYILENETEALDISKISKKPNEEESIITKGKEYLVTYTRVFKNGGVAWKIIKLKNEE